MKRRAAMDGSGSKVRRPVGLGIKKTKLIDGIYTSAWLYIKFLLVWAVVLTADFMLDFRFEFLWPIWMLLRSTFDSIRYQGYAFSIFFICISLTSDIVCYLFIPVQWLFFAASTYIWVQYVWHTDRGVCLPTISLWLLFVYIETTLRLRDVKCLPFHWDLCRPFAAHCIGYPVVTLGFGCKTYLSYKLRLRKQMDIQRENSFYYELLQRALPPVEQVSTVMEEEGISIYNSQTAAGGGCIGNLLQTHASLPPSTQLLVSNGQSSSISSTNLDQTNTKRSHASKSEKSESRSTTLLTTTSFATNDLASKDISCKQKGDMDILASITATMDDVGGSSVRGTVGLLRSHTVAAGTPSPVNVNNYRPEENVTNDSNAKVYKETAKSLQLGNGIVKASNAVASTNTNSGVVRNGSASKDTSASQSSCSTKNNLVASNGGCGKENTAQMPLTNKKSNNTSNKDDAIIRLETDIKRLRSDLQSSRTVEHDLHVQVNTLVTADRACKAEVYQLRQDNESLQSKLQNLVTAKQKDKQLLATLERKLTEERRQRSVYDQQLTIEKKKKQDELSTARSTPAVRMECPETCKARRLELENEVQQALWELKRCSEQVHQLNLEAQKLRQYKEAQTESEELLSVFLALREKNSHLENSLSSETRLKLDLFSALGDAKRQFEIQHGMLLQRELEVADLKTKVAEVMALVPSTSGFGSICTDSPPHFSAAFTTELNHNELNHNQPSSCGDGEAWATSPSTPPTTGGSELLKSSLNPNASDYRPKLASI